MMTYPEFGESWIFVILNKLLRKVSALVNFLIDEIKHHDQDTLYKKEFIRCTVPEGK